MLSPDDLLHISEGAEEISEALHNEIVKRIIERMMLRIGRGEDYLLTAQDKWQIETLQQAGFLLEDIQKEIAQKAKLQQKEIAEAMENAGVKSLEYDEKLYKQVGIENKDLNKSPELLRLVQRNYEATMGEFKNFTGTMAEQTQQLFIKECDRAYALVSTGAMSYTEAVKEVVENIVSEGVQVHYPTGHKDTIETATMRAVRTGVSQMSAQIQIKRMEENEVEKVIISSHLGARPSHNVWQGKVFDLKELKSTDTGMPAYGTVTGLCGANCRHSFSPYFDFMDNPFKEYDSEENKKQYEKEQRQRTLERRIRKTKIETMGIKSAVDNCKDKKTKFELDLQYQKKAALLSKQNEEYKKYCENNKLKPLAERIRIANWNREQAAAARGAAKRYENAHGKTEIDKNKTQEEKIITIEDANKRSTNVLAVAYEKHRIYENLKTVPYKELGEGANNIVYANYGKMSVESAKAFSDTIEKLSKEYNTPLQRIRTMTKEEAFGNNSFAFVHHNYTVDDAELVINPIKCKDLEKLKNRIKELVKRGYSVKIPEEMADKYIATHEFAHTLIHLEQPLKNKTNWVGANYEKIKKARKEITAVYDKYLEENAKLKNELDILFGYDLNQNDIEKVFEIMELISNKQDEIDKIKISEYSFESADEFMAEAFVNEKIGVNSNKYAKQVVDILDKYFKG